MAEQRSRRSNDGDDNANVVVDDRRDEEDNGRGGGECCLVVDEKETNHKDNGDAVCDDDDGNDDRDKIDVGRGLDVLDDMESDDDVDNSTIPIDRGRAWHVMISCFLVHILVVGLGKSFGVFVQEFQDRFQVGAKELGAINGMALMLMFCSSIFVNMLVVRFSARRVVISGSIVASAGFIMTAFIPSFNWLYVTYGLVIGVGFGLSFSPTIVMVGQSFKKYRALALGISLSGSGIGSFGVPNLVRILVKEYTLQGCLLIIGALVLNVSLCGLLLPPQYPPRHPPKKELSNNGIGKHRRGRRKSRDSFVDLKEGGLEKLIKGDHFEAEITAQTNSAANGKYNGCVIGTEKDKQSFLPTDIYSGDSEKNRGLFGSQNSIPRIKVNDFNKIIPDLPVEKGVQCPDSNNSNFHLSHQLALNNGHTTSLNGTPAPNQISLYDKALHNIHSSQENNNFSKSTKSLRDDDLHYIAVTRNNTALSPNQNKRETNLSISTSHLPDQSKTNALASIQSSNSKHSLNKLSSGLAYASNCNIAMVSQGNLDRLSIMTSVSQELNPLASRRDDRVRGKVPLLELSMLRSPTFVMHLLSVLLGFTCYMNNLFMLADYASTCGHSRDMAALTLSIVGIIESVARVTFAPLTDVLCCRRRRAFAAALTAMGLLNICAPYMKSLSNLMAYAVLFGYTCGCFGCLIPVLCAEINGPDKMGSSFGLTTFGMGLALMVGPPICGAMKDQTGYWDDAFVTMGVLSLIAAILAFLEPTVEERLGSRKSKDRL